MFKLKLKNFVDNNIKNLQSKYNAGSVFKTKLDRTIIVNKDIGAGKVLCVGDANKISNNNLGTILGKFKARWANDLLLNSNIRFNEFCLYNKYINKNQWDYSNSQLEGYHKALTHSCIAYQNDKNSNEIYFSIKTSSSDDIPFITEDYEGIDKTEYIKVIKIDNVLKESYISPHLYKLKLNFNETFDNNNYIKTLKENKIKYFFYKDEEFIKLHKDKTIDLYNTEIKLANWNCLYTNIHNIVIFNKKNEHISYEKFIEFIKYFEEHQLDINLKLKKFGIENQILKINEI